MDSYVFTAESWRYLWKCHSWINHLSFAGSWGTGSDLFWHLLRGSSPWTGRQFVTGLTQSLKKQPFMLTPEHAGETHTDTCRNSTQPRSEPRTVLLLGNGDKHYTACEKWLVLVGSLQWIKDWTKVKLKVNALYQVNFMKTNFIWNISHICNIDTYFSKQRHLIKKIII